ncbi:uncharacterized protein N7511_011043 [Penicillium nucicola]|uniref:uncharacterized protein n=1 Tax=Penicillium nucicola TaxID=1850975 RepID=UPI00254525B8|nr:uncharacterized protein N7511_011043 [Penicillium nucicola]KAJ5749347.1 hypothetical protein N7511_011043 [Penicillium nucicola]
MYQPLWILFQATCSIATLVNRPPELRVVISRGVVYGIYNNTAQTVRAFLGIPYAESPVGRLRFAPPQPKLPTQYPIDASSFRNSCPQVYTYSNESIWRILPYKIWNAASMSEDCLHINIWTPSFKHQGRSARKAAVMMFMHGGGYGSGSGSVAFYDGTTLVQENDDVIVVTFNYRLNVFGFPNAPGLNPLEQNLGLMDQRLAVKWVHENIANFGGDPKRILLFGQSAGASSVDIYSYAYPDNPLVSAFALHSGTARLLTTEPDHENWNQLSTALGCGSDVESLRCMRRVPAAKIVEVRTHGNYTFYPIIDNRNVFADYAARTAKGRLARLPTLAGITEHEFSAIVPLSQESVNETEIYENVQKSFNCPLRETIKMRLDQNVPTWRYLYRGNFSSLSPTPWLGAYHTAEIPIVFGTYHLSYPRAPSAEEAEASRYLQGAWVAFTKDPLHGLSQYGWPQFHFDGRSLHCTVLVPADH